MMALIEFKEEGLNNDEWKRYKLSPYNDIKACLLEYCRDTGGTSCTRQVRTQLGICLSGTTRAQGVI